MSEPQENNGDSPTYPKYAKGVDLFFMGVSIVIGGQYFSWNKGLLGGFWEYFFSMVLTGFAYLALVLCLSEMTSALPFSGGVYGFIRATIGPFMGYIVGVCELLQNISYVSCTALPLAHMITDLSNEPEDYRPIYWILFYISALVILIWGNHVLWKFNLIIGIVSLVILLIYIFGSIPYVDFERYASASSTSYEFSGSQMIQHFHLASWFYIGVQSLPLCCVDCNDPKTEIPWAMSLCMLTLFVTSIAVYFVTCGQDPGTHEIASSAFPLDYGFSRMFGISPESATWLSFPATYATGFGFMFCYGRQISAMAKSGLLPSLFQHSTSFSHTPYLALLFGTFISVIIVLIIEFAAPDFMEELFLVCMLASYVVYIFAFIAYIIFVQKYSSVTRAFHNPLGIACAVYGIVVFAIGFIGTVGFQDSDWVPIVLFTFYLILATVYYLLHAMKNQKFSLDEQKALFTAYVINANAQTRKKKKKRVAPSAASSSAGSVAGNPRKSNKTNSVVPMSNQSFSRHSEEDLSELDEAEKEMLKRGSLAGDSVVDRESVFDHDEIPGEDALITKAAFTRRVEATSDV